MNQVIQNKFNEVKKNIIYLDKIPKNDQRIIENISNTYSLSFQEIRNLFEISRDLEMWQETSFEDLTKFSFNAPYNLQPKNYRKKIIADIKKEYLHLKGKEKNYDLLEVPKKREEALSFKVAKNDSKILSTCPVYSEKTLCCNLLTLDVALNCGFGCSYCSIQSFYEGKNTILLEENLEEKLNEIKIDPTQTYHIGTGQSSDSLIWGNKNDNMQILFNWVKKHPNIVLELKTKSKNIKFLTQTNLPKNIIFTWTINPDIIIQTEERFSASLEERLRSARKLADKGAIVGFHFHPIIYFQNWELEYSKIIKRILNMFNSREVALISIGTLTFTPNVMKEIRQKSIHSKILQMDLVEADGKLSYPDHIKQALFKHIYQEFSPWHDQVFYYLCMENKRHWKPVFGFEYKDNIEFEEAMKNAYLTKVNQSEIMEHEHI